MTSPRDLALAVKAKRYDAKYALRIVLEARRSGIPVSLGFALVEQESNFQNVFGHDPTIFAGAGKVTAYKYREYKCQRDAQRPRRMQGVGPCQLTWYATQDRADKRGGCHVPRHNIAQAFDALALNIRACGLEQGIAAYNGSGPAAQRYSTAVRMKMGRWHRRLVG
jgi:hypothetical protein